MNKEEHINALKKSSDTPCTCGLYAVEEVSSDLVITTKQLPSDECYTRKTEDKPRAIVLHHTAGRHNPDRVVDNWAGDARGRIATHFVIGGQSVDGKDLSHDGRIVRAMTDGQWAWHLGALGRDGNARTQGIEICSAGGLKNGLTWFNAEVASSQITTLRTTFRGYKQFHSYSDAQLVELKKLILNQANEFDIDVREGLVTKLKTNSDPFVAFRYDGKITAENITGLVSHTNVRSGKSDVFPQPELVDMLLSL